MNFRGICRFKRNPNAKPGIKDYDRLIAFEGGVLTKLILKSRSLDELNSGVLSLMGV